MKGKIRLTEAKAVFPAKFDTKKTVHHAVDGGKYHHNDGGHGKAQKLIVSKVV